MSERTEAKRDGAKLHKNSGRGWKKGDASMYNYVVDYKDASKSFTLNKKVWAKVCTDTMKVSTEANPMLAITLGDGNQRVRLAIVERDRIHEYENHIDMLKQEIEDLKDKIYGC